ncbi:ribonuclease H, partial [Trifolium pratense]
MLSQAGKEVMIKLVAQAISTYCMSVFLLPMSIGDEIEKMLNSFWWGIKEDGSKGIRWMSWDMLTMRKEWGGMGFRVSLGHNPIIYVWCSVWSSRTLLKHGYRWKVGDGSLIPIENTPWLRDDQNPLITTTSNLHVHDQKVSSLIDSGTGQWDIEGIQTNFNDRDAREVLKIPLLPQGAQYEIIWRYDKKGMHSVKSAYRVCVDIMIDRSEWRINGEWNKLRALAIPPKVKHFMWRLGRDCLPSRQRLSSKDSIACWRQQKLWSQLEQQMLLADGFKEFFTNILQRFHEDQLIAFAMTAWSLWRKRNMHLWENKIETIMQVVHRANNTIQAWRQAKLNNTNRPHQSQHDQRVPWQTPPPSYLKCNIDAAVFSHDNKVSLGACLRDEKGVFVAAFSCHENGSYTACEAEAWGLYKRIEWIALLGY